MTTLEDMKEWARLAKAAGEILDWATADYGRAITVLTDQGWCPAMYGSDTEPERINGCDPRDESDAGFFNFRST